MAVSKSKPWKPSRSQCWWAPSKSRRQKSMSSRGAVYVSVIMISFLSTIAPRDEAGKACSASSEERRRCDASWVKKGQEFAYFGHRFSQLQGGVRCAVAGCATEDALGKACPVLFFISLKAKACPWIDWFFADESSMALLDWPAICSKASSVDLAFSGAFAEFYSIVPMELAAAAVSLAMVASVWDAALADRFARFRTSSSSAQSCGLARLLGRFRWRHSRPAGWFWIRSIQGCLPWNAWN